VAGRSLFGGCGRFFLLALPPEADDGAHFCYETSPMMSARMVSPGMMSVRNFRVGAAVAALALTAMVAASPGYAQSEPAAPDAAASPAPKKTLRQKVKALVAQITPDRIKRDIEFRKASALFPQFCARDPTRRSSLRVETEIPTATLRRSERPGRPTTSTKLSLISTSRGCTSSVA